jgi:hypothetical protein
MSRFPSRSKALAIVVGMASIVILLSTGIGYGFNDRLGPLGPAAEVQERHTGRMMANPDVVGTAVGLTEDGRPAVKVLTKRSGVAGIPEELEGFPVEVEVTGEIFALPANGSQGPPTAQAKGNPGTRIDPTAWFDRPVPIGVSTGNAGECSAGTIGARVKDSSGNVYALSNNHVYALENDADIGSVVLQPGRYDTQCSNDLGNAIGTLWMFESIKFDGTSNTIDAAIALLDSDNILDFNTPSNGYGAPSSIPGNASANLAVKKYGRTTSLTHGTVSATNGTINVSYSSGIALFTNQIVVVPKKGAFIKAGDSGSLLVTEEGNNPVGLLFAGNSNGRYAIANPISAVLEKLKVSIDDGQ